MATVLQPATRAALASVVLAGVLTLTGLPSGAASAPSSTSTPSAPPATTKPLVGAYYYLWNPANLPSGTLREHLDPSQQPPTSEVGTQRPRAVGRDITNATRAGIDFFAVDWWPYVASSSARNYLKADDRMQDFLKAPNLDHFKFAMFYETWNLGFLAGVESTPVTPQLEAHFDADMVTFAEQYFTNPSYLRIDGRPVVFLYLTRTLTGDVAGMMQGARAAVGAHGFDPYFIGDEVYWRVTPENPVAGGPVLTNTPQVPRIEQFDAVTSYILYFGDPLPQLGPIAAFMGYPGLTNVVEDEKFLLTVYRNATNDQVPVIPDIGPGFNDRGYRLPTNHPAQPRQWLPGAGPASTLDHLFRDMAVPEMDPKLPMVMVTSWNDWNEDTGIEPISGTPTDRDDSPSGTAYTQGYTYGGEGWHNVDTLGRDVATLDREWAERQPRTGVTRS